MPNSALTEVITYSPLHRAWRTIYVRARPASRNTRGIDDVSLNDFALDPKTNLRRLAWELAHKEFHFSTLRPHLIPKLSGKDRLICVPTVRDRIVQRALLDYLTHKYGNRLENRISFGFVKKRTVQQAAKIACSLRFEHPWVFKTDITAFFDQIDRSVLAAAIKRIIRDRSLHKLLIEALSLEISPPSDSVARRIAKLGIKKGRGIRQGMPLSPFFANLILQPFDNAVVQANFLAVRYADDLVFFAPNEQKCYEIHGFCRTELGKLDLTIPDIGQNSKSRIYPPKAPAEFLGLGLCLINAKYELRVMDKQIEKIKSELMQLSSISELLSRKITLAHLGFHIQNRISGYQSAYEACTNIHELDRALADLNQKILRIIYVDGLKINLATLSAEARTFIGLAGQG